MVVQHIAMTNFMKFSPGISFISCGLRGCGVTSLPYQRPLLQAFGSADFSPWLSLRQARTGLLTLHC
jgi:hypothetical protein